jgi:hypothetical protein
MAQEVERLPTKCEALNSNPSTTKKKKQERLHNISSLCELITNKTK